MQLLACWFWYSNTLLVFIWFLMRDTEFYGLLLLTVRTAMLSGNRSWAWRCVCLEAWFFAWNLEVTAFFFFFSCLTSFPIEQVVGSVNDGLLRALLFRNLTQFLWSLPVTLHLADCIVTWELVIDWGFLGGFLLVVLTESVFLLILLVCQWGITLMRSFQCFL